MSTITCPSCNRNYPFKAELAGRKVKCKCGQVIAVPQASEAEDLYDMAPDEAKSAPIPAIHSNTGPTCPSCGNLLVGGSVICVQCGFNLKTRQHMQTAGTVATPAPTKSVRPGAALPTGLKPKQVQESRSDITKWVLVLLVIGGLVGGSLLALRFLGHDPESDKPVLDADDNTVRAALKDEFPKEAREWLKTDSSWMMGGWSAGQANSRIDEWYRMGAKKVYCFGTRMALWVAIELPDEKEKRAAIFEWQAKWHAEMFERVRKDKGQKYLVVKLRL